MPHGLLPILACVALVAGVFSYVSAYHQLAHAYIARQARRQALAATVGPVVFYGFLAVVLFMGVPLMLHA